VTALVELVVMDELGKRPLCPTARCRIDLIGKRTYGYRDRDVLDVEKCQLVFPIETSRRDRSIRQPVERDVVEDVISRETFGFSVEDTRYELVTARVVVEDPGCEADGGILDP
jgi:hypothetical protein